MSNLIHTETAMPGVELMYLRDSKLAGIHVRGLARLLDCDPKTVSNAVEAVNLEDVLDAEIETPQGLTAVKFILENGVIDVLEKLQDGKHKAETKSMARDLYRRFARAGFKLYTMMNVCPEEIADELPPSVAEFDPEIERLKLQNEGWRLQNEHLRLRIQREQEASAKSTPKAKAKIYDFPKRGSAAAPPVDKNGLTREMLRVVEICRKNGWCTARVVCQGTKLVKSSDQARDIFRELKLMDIGELRQTGKSIEFRVKQEWLDAHPAAEVSESLEKLQQLCFHS